MKIAVIRHGVGREAKKVLPFLENTIYKDIFKITILNLNFFIYLEKLRMKILKEATKRI